MPAKLTNESFIQKANLIHNERYDYQFVEYTNAQTKIKIICEMHGVFEQSPASHLNGQGCSLCGNETKGKSKTATAKSEFSTKANIIHNNKYDYSLVEYKNNATKISIICPIHGVFEQIPNSHLNGHGCKACANEALVATAKSEFETKANLVHNSKYSYELVDYKNAITKIKITCPIHGEFLQSPMNHLFGYGCKACGIEESGFTRTHFKEKCKKNNGSKGILYILECFNDSERFFKIGITSNSIKKRYSSKTQMPYAYSVVKEIIGDPAYIYDLETKLHQINKENQYIPSIPFCGSSTECFIKYKEN